MVNVGDDMVQISPVRRVIRLLLDEGKKMKSFVKKLKVLQGLFFACLSGVLLFIGSYIVYMHMHTVRAEYARVAIVLADDLYFHTQGYAGVCRKYEQGEKKKKYLLEPFYFHAHGDTSSLPAALAALSKWQPMAVIAFGKDAAAGVIKTIPGVPLVYVGITDWSADSLAARVIAGELDCATMVRLLHAAKPGARKIVVPYDASENNEFECHKDIDRIRKVGNQLHIQVMPVPLQNVADFEREIAPFLDEYDVVMTLECQPLEEIASQLAVLCEKTKTTFFSGSLAGVDAGAALSFGGYPQVLGKAAFGMVQKIIEDQSALAALSIGEVTGNRQFIINAERVSAQDMQPVDEKAVRLRMLRHQETVQFTPNLKILWPNRS